MEAGAKRNGEEEKKGEREGDGAGEKGRGRRTG